jgi:two-component SAPR family response regulator
MKKLLFILGIMFFAVSCRYVNDASNTAFKEFKPSELLKKYEYYKDASAALDKKIADIQVYSVRVKTMEDAYKGVKRSEWAKDDREQLSIWMSEVAGIKASYNTLAAEYNSAMSKFNWAFCNTGTLPQGATNPLPREYKPYITQ